MLPYHTDRFEVGIDEAGRGPLLGPVFAAAVILGDIDYEHPIAQMINDSKKLSKKKRELCYDWITQNVLSFGISFCTEQEIDEMNILNATRHAMKRAINSLSYTHFSLLVIDGVRWEDKFDYETISVVKGDATYFNIACASIIAKVAHDEYITTLCRLYPSIDERYDIMNNMGYGTPRHKEGIRKYGKSKFHRQSFNINL